MHLAPGYKERILFPLDLSLLRKMIVARMIKSFASLHQRVALICHNCVKFNGRYVVLTICFVESCLYLSYSNHYLYFHLSTHSESDYAVITRDFEDHVDDKVLEAVKNAATATAMVAPSSAVVATATIASTPATAPVASAEK